jgi:hypothetical protein
MSLCGTLKREISRKLNISCKCICQTICKFDELHTVATKPGAGRPPKVTDRQKRAIKLRQLRDGTFSLNDLNNEYIKEVESVNVLHRLIYLTNIWIKRLDLFPKYKTNFFVYNTGRAIILLYHVIALYYLSLGISLIVF